MPDEARELDGAPTHGEQARLAALSGEGDTCEGVALDDERVARACELYTGCTVDTGN